MVAALELALQAVRMGAGGGCGHGPPEPGRAGAPGTFHGPGDEEMALAVLDATGFSPGSPWASGRDPPGRTTSRQRDLATTRVHVVVYLVFDFGNRRELRAFDGDLRLLWSVAHPSLTHLITDVLAKLATAAMAWSEGPIGQRVHAAPSRARSES